MKVDVVESLANLESFVRSAELGGFSAAARRLALTPAAVSRNVAALECNLGVRLFQRSTRKLTLTEAGERFLGQIEGNLDALQAAIAAVTTDRDAPTGVLRVSLSPTFGERYILPMLPAFMARYPAVRIDWRLENRQADLIAEGLDAAIGGGFPLGAGLVSRALAPVHVVAVASPAYLAGKARPMDPSGLSALDGIVMRPVGTGRVRDYVMRDVHGAEMSASPRATIVLNDPAAMRRAALLGLGVALLAVPDVMAHLESGELVRLLPRWYADLGPLSLYYANRAQLPAKTRVFIDHVAEVFRRERYAERFAGSLG